MKVSLDLSNLEEAAKREAARSLVQKGVSLPCQFCGSVFHLEKGENTCPNCGKTIEAINSLVK